MHVGSGAGADVCAAGRAGSGAILRRQATRKMIQGLKMPGRPPHLPEFLNPPVSEVAIGVQFRPPLGYQQIRAGEVWNLYRSDYPNAEEQSPLPPAFETFGPPRSQSQPPINFVSGATHDRFWFISESGAELIQFQDDRLMHNWREMGLPDNPYPRFEQMIAKFEAELTELGRYIKGLAPQDLQINQCEVTYINTIKVDELPDSRPSTWLRGLEMPTGAVEDFHQHRIHHHANRRSGLSIPGRDCCAL